MNAINKIKDFLNTQEFLAYLIALVLSTLLVGYALSGIIIMVFVFFSIRYSVIQKDKIKINLALLLPILLYILFVLSLLWSVDPNKTKIGLGRTAVLFLIPMAFSFTSNLVFRNYNLILKHFTKANILFGLLFLITAGFNFFKTRSFSVLMYHDLVSVLELNAIYVSLIFSISLFYLLSKKSKTKIDKIAILFFVVLLILLSSKTMMMVLFIGAILYVFYNRNNWFSGYKLLLISITTVLIIGIGSVSIKERFLVEKTTNFKDVLNKEKFAKVYPWTGISIRLLQLRILNDQVNEEGIFWKGFGLFASRKNIKKRQIQFNIWKGFHEYNYHNQYAQIFSETGIFGLVILLLMLLVNLVKALKSKNFLFIMFSILIPIVFLTESFLWRQRGLFLFIIVYCLLNNTNFVEQPSKLPSNINPGPHI